MLTLLLVMLFVYLKKQYDYHRSVCRLQLVHEKIILATRLEVQEQTFHHISREIHDNISLSLTLAKSHLHGFDWDDPVIAHRKVNASIGLIGKSIYALSDISKSLNAEVIIQDGLIHALEEEIVRIRQIGFFDVDFIVTGSPVYMATQREMIIFRIIQEAFNNIIKHARARKTALWLHYSLNELVIKVTDNGIGFVNHVGAEGRKAGLKNMECRIRMLGGRMSISSEVDLGTAINYTLPLT